MEVNIKEIVGSWNLGYSLDKHTLHSTPIGHNQWGHMQFDTVRPDAGEALYQLKYRNDFSQAPIIAEQMHISLGNAFSTANLVIPMPPSRHRARQPVTEIARELSQRMGIPCYEELLIKTKNTPSMKDISSRDEKISTLVDAFSINDLLANEIIGVRVKFNIINPPPLFFANYFVEDVDALFSRAVEAGAAIVKPVEDQFYGDRTGTVKDPYGHVWFI